MLCCVRGSTEVAGRASNGLLKDVGDGDGRGDDGLGDDDKCGANLEIVDCLGTLVSGLGFTSGPPGA